MRAPQLILSFCGLTLFVGMLPAQGAPDDESKKIVQQIQKDLESLVDEYAKLSGNDSLAETGERVKNNIDKLLDGLDQQQNRVMSNIDQLIEQQKQQSSSSSGGEGQSKGQSKPQSKGEKRDRNQEPKDGKDGKDGKQGGEKKPQPKPGQSDPKSGEKSGQDPEQANNGRKTPGGEAEQRIDVVDDSLYWAGLPPETKQFLIENNFREYFPDYEREISEYLKSLNRKKR
ncbi:MAG: hypothetical protein KDB53_04715 [Planctomycetes bacterium]|nr:hypothetical protein [Planctomycetota bacterium]